MNIVIDSSALESGHRIRGVGNYTRNLISELERIAMNSYNLVVNSYNVNKEKKKLSNYDLIHYPFFDLFFITLPAWKRTKTVVTIHDVIPLIFPNNYPSGIRGFINFQIQKILLKKIDAVITDSIISKKDIIKYLGYPANKIYPIYLGIENYFKVIKNKRILTEVSQKYKLPKKFVLYVGDVNYNKNLIVLAEACKTVEIPLVIVGKQAIAEEFDRLHPENKMWSNFLDKYSNDPTVIRVGYVESKDLVAIYNIATVYCQPSLYEGFGIPVLEAMSCGLPVVCSNTPTLKEIAGDATLYFRLNVKNDLSKKLKQVITQDKLKKKLVAKGFNNIKKFSWSKCGRSTLKVYEKVVLI